MVYLKVELVVEDVKLVFSDFFFVRFGVVGRMYKSLFSKFLCFARRFFIFFVVVFICLFGGVFGRFIFLFGLEGS